MTTSAVLRINTPLQRFDAAFRRVGTPLQRFGAALPPFSVLVPGAGGPVLRICAPRAGIRQVGAQ
jgi:hypothetical protein